MQRYLITIEFSYARNEKAREHDHIERSGDELAETFHLRLALRDSSSSYEP